MKEKVRKKKAPTPGFEPRYPCGNKISSLAQYQIVPRWQVWEEGL
tara:strand:+ start:3660 stop:3794 length:135 start_codon:yes stop_codon:yes gene_type:complete